MSCTFPTLGAWDAGQGVAGSHGKTKLLLQSSNMKKKTPIYSQQIPLLVCHPQCNISSRSVKTHARNPIIVTSTPTHLPASSTPDNHPACVRVLGSAEANPCPLLALQTIGKTSRFVKDEAVATVVEDENKNGDLTSLYLP